jgi:hypothetical protein
MYCCQQNVIMYCCQQNVIMYCCQQNVIKSLSRWHTFCARKKAFSVG